MGHCPSFRVISLLKKRYWSTKFRHKIAVGKKLVEVHKNTLHDALNWRLFFWCARTEVATTLNRIKTQSRLIHNVIPVCFCHCTVKDHLYITSAYFLPFLDPTHPPYQHIHKYLYSTEHQQNGPFYRPTQPFCWRNIGMVSNQKFRVTVLIEGFSRAHKGQPL